MACGADWGGFGNHMGIYYDFSTSASGDRSLGLQYAGQRASFQAFGRSMATTRAAVQADILADAVAGWK